jgi:hypothetical protein
MIKIQGWHGKLSEKKSAKVDGIAAIATPRYQWIYNGTVGEFSEQWKDNFLCYWIDDGWMIFITDYSSFGQR